MKIQGGDNMILGTILYTLGFMTVGLLFLFKLIECET